MQYSIVIMFSPLLWLPSLSDLRMDSALELHMKEEGVSGRISLP